MKHKAEVRFAEVKQAVEQKLNDTEKRWREVWQDKWANRFEGISSNISNKLTLSRARGISILNGLIGDFLVAKGISVAVQMGFYHHQQLIELDKDNLSQVLPEATGKLCILVHGLGCTENVWRFNDDDSDTYGTRLAKALGYTTLSVRYNTGLHISHNGQMLSQLMASLFEQYPCEIEQVIFITHSMGGLVTRSACFYGSQSDSEWTTKVKQLYFLGSPHLGADLEKFGSVVAQALQSSPLPYSQFLGQLLDMRSAGIKDLRFGYVRDEDWKGHDDSKVLLNNKDTVPLLDGAEHYVITGTVTKDSEHVLSQLFGDALVRKYSATGQSINEKHTLRFPADHQVEFTQVVHVALAHHEKVYQQILMWVKASHDEG